MGAVVVSDKESKDLKLVKDSILVYSAGYVDRIKIISDTPEGNKRRVELDIWISSSKIAERILSVYAKDQNIDGGRMAEQFRTYARSKQQGDKLLTNVLELFPHNAFYAEIKQTDFKVDQYRTPYLRIAYSIKWNKSFYIALEETVKIISDGNQARKNPAATMVFAGGSSWFLQPYYFNDVIPLQIINQKFYSKNPSVKLSVVDQNKILFSTCQSLQPNFFYGAGYGNMDLAGDKIYNSEFNIKIPNNIPSNVKTTLTIESEDRCPA